MVDVLYKVYVLTLRFKYYFDDAKLCKNAKTKRISFKTKPKWLNKYVSNRRNLHKTHKLRDHL